MPDQTHHIDVELSADQYSLLRTALARELDWHHSEGRPELARACRELLECLDVNEEPNAQ